MGRQTTKKASASPGGALSEYDALRALVLHAASNTLCDKHEARLSGTIKEGERPSPEGDALSPLEDKRTKSGKRIKVPSLFDRKDYGTMAPRELGFEKTYTDARPFATYGKNGEDGIT